MDQFEKYKPSLTKDQVINYLLSWKRRGFQIVEGRPLVTNGWSVEFGGNKWVGIRPASGSQGVWETVWQQGVSRGLFSTLDELRIQFEGLAKALGVQIDTPPKQHHTSATKPLTVWIQFRSMIASAKIEAIYDPFVENKALINLLDLESFGAKFTKKLRILTSEKSSITQNALDKFNTQPSIQAEGKKTAKADILASHGRTKHHLRFILLDDGRCLSMDFSLNDEQEGTIFETDTAPKLAIFNDAWAKGNPL